MPLANLGPEISPVAIKAIGCVVLLKATLNALCVASVEEPYLSIALETFATAGSVSIKLWPIQLVKSGSVTKSADAAVCLTWPISGSQKM